MPVECEMIVQERAEHVEAEYGRYICRECDDCGVRILSTVEWMVQDEIDECPRCGHPDAVAWQPSVLRSVLNDPVERIEYNKALELVEESGAAVIFEEEVFRISKIGLKSVEDGDRQ